MKKLLFISLLAALCGCDSNEPSLSEIENGFRYSFSRDTGIPESRISARAKKLGSGRWAIKSTTTRYDGARRSLNATAIMDENGDIHYYTD